VNPPEPYVAQPATLATATGTLHGTLLAPQGGPAVPVVLIHPGSGPTDRDGNSPLLAGKNNSLRLLAEGLAARGIATLRIDKRGIAESAAALGTEADLRLETLAADAAAWLELLRRDPRFDRVIVLGHSEGALIGALAAADAQAEGYISVAGPARRGSDILRRQLGPRLSGPSLPRTSGSSPRSSAVSASGPFRSRCSHCIGPASGRTSSRGSDSSRSAQSGDWPCRS